MINKSDILINNSAYDWASITLAFNIPELADQTIFGVSKIEYSNEMPIVNNYGKGRLPVSFGRQNITATASITLSASELVKLENIAPEGVVQDILKFDAIVEYLTAPSQAFPEGEHRTDIIKDCHIDKDGRSISQNDPESLIDIELNPSYIDFNV